ncbi:MAG: hypothetical protein J6D01_00320, partial [Muribaculaceae bacterium]|nr:hypothetical protein [Muribaculaceae bacterium]
NDNMKGFDTFISDANRDFIDFMRHPWKKYEGKEPEKKRVVPEPPKMPVYDPKAPEAKEPPKRLTIKEILDLTTEEDKQQGTTTAQGGTSVTPAPAPTPKPVPKAAPKPKPDTVKVTQPKPQPTPAPVISQKPTPKPTPVPVTPAPAKPTPTPTPAPSKPSTSPLYSGGAGRTRINFMGVDYHVSNALDKAVTLKGIDENSLADGLETLYKSNYKPLLEDLRAMRSRDLGNDWALYLVVKQIAEKFGGKNESVLMRQFLLNNLGFRARMAKVIQKNALTLLVAPASQLYGCAFISEGGAKFYDVEADQPYSYKMCAKEAPDAKHKIDMSMRQTPRFGGTRKSSSHQGERYKAAASASVPVELMEFYKRLPQCDYSVYATAKVDKKFSDEVLDALRPAIKGKSEREAANILLDFVQSGFEYATDPEQFGYEKPFFVEELFYYPYCDCEDRSMLYRYLVTQLLGLDVILLDYPGHIATAVRFNGDVPGDFVVGGGGKYIVCDPTFIGAPVGMAMPQFKNTAADMLKY